MCVFSRAAQLEKAVLPRGKEPHDCHVTIGTMGTPMTQHPIARLMFRNIDGTFTASGWFAIALAGFFAAGAILFMVFPTFAISQNPWLRRTPHPVVLARLISVVMAAIAVWLGLPAVAAGPGQLV